MFTDMGSSAHDGWQDSAEQWFAARIDDPGCCFIVVEVAGDVVSCAVGFRRETIPSPGNPSGGDVHINNVSTRPEHRGRGHASAALAEVMRWAETTGVRRAELMATASGQRLYERVGFTVHEYPAMRAPLACSSSEPQAGPAVDGRLDRVRRVGSDDVLPSNGVVPSGEARR